MIASILTVGAFRSVVSTSKEALQSQMSKLETSTGVDGGVTVTHNLCWPVG